MAQQEGWNLASPVFNYLMPVRPEEKGPAAQQLIPSTALSQPVRVIVIGGPTTPSLPLSLPHAYHSSKPPVVINCWLNGYPIGEKWSAEG